MNTVPAKRFYTPESKPFVPPLLRPNSRARTAVLAAKQAEDPSRAAFRTFPTQAQAFRFADTMSHLRVWAFEIDDKGRRRFLVSSPPQLWRWYRRVLRRPSARLHMYEVIRRGCACKLYFDLEFRRDSESTRTLKGEPLEAEVERVVALVFEEWSGRTGASGTSDMVRLQSSTDSKFSTHLIFPSICFRNNAECGVFVVEVESRLCSLSRDISFVDCAVYTPNRCFRLVGSSKFGRAQRLLPPHSYAAGSSARPSCSEQLFYSSLVCSVSDSAQLMTLPAGRSSVGSHLVASEQGVGGTLTSALTVCSRQATSEFPRVDEYVLGLIRPRNGQIYTVTRFIGSSSLSYAIKGGWRYCHRIGRHHRSNNVVIVVSLKEGMAHQRCFDPDCRDYISPPWAVPLEHLPYSPSLPEEDSAQLDKDLEAFMDEWEEQTGQATTNEPPVDYSGGLSDDVLAAASHIDCNK